MERTPNLPLHILLQQILKSRNHLYTSLMAGVFEPSITYGDTIEFVDFDYARKLTGLNVATLASLAKAPAPPVDVEISGQVTANTTLSWKPVSGAVGYKVYWRLTADLSLIHI